MANEKILDLSYMSEEDFKMVDGAIKFWKDSEVPGKVDFIADSESQYVSRLINDALTISRGKGFCIGVVTTMGICAVWDVGQRVFKYIKSKKKVE